MVDTSAKADLVQVVIAFILKITSYYFATFFLKIGNLAVIII
jgi:hypothetical protein